MNLQERSWGFVQSRNGTMTDDNSILSKHSKFLLVGIILLGVVLRMQGLTRSFWYDEVGYSTLVGFRTLFGGMWNRIWEDPAAPFYPLLMSFWVRLFGDSELSVRMLPFLCGILSIVLIYLVALKLTDRLSAMIASFLLALSPVHVWYSREAVPYSMLVLLALMSVYSFYKIKEKGRIGGWCAVYFLSLLIAVFTHWFVIVLVVVFSCLVLSEKNKRVKFLVWGLNSSIFIFPLCFLIVKSKITLVPILSGAFFLRAFTPFEGWMLFFNWFSMGNAIWPINPYSHEQLKSLLGQPYLLFSQFFFAYLFTKGLIAQVRETRRIDLCLYLFALPLTLILLSLQWPHLYIERYALILLPFFYIAVGKGATHFKRRWLRFSAYTLLAILGAAAMDGSLSCGSKEIWSVYKPNEDWRSAVDYFDKDQSVEGDPVVVLTTASAISLRYHQEQFKKSKKKFPDLRIFRYRKGSLYSLVRRQKTKVFYLIEDVYWKMNFDALKKAADSDARFEFLTKTTLSGLRIFKYHVKSLDMRPN